MQSRPVSHRRKAGTKASGRGAPDEPPASLAVRVSAAMGFNIEL